MEKESIEVEGSSGEFAQRDVSCRVLMGWDLAHASARSMNYIRTMPGDRW
jgi:hypothetical protein